MGNNKKNNQIVVYQTRNGAIELKGDIHNETIWATQAQITNIFNIDRTVVTKHIGNILKSNEVNKKSNVQKMHITNSDKPVSLYSLDIILAIGYRTNSARAIAFRQWATKTLREHITKGYTINRSQIKNNYSEFMQAVENLKVLLPTGSTIDQKSVLELVSAFSATWLSIDAYDKDKLATTGTTKRSVMLTAQELSEALTNFKIEITKRGEASELFGRERESGSIQGIVGNIMQSFGGKPLYPTLEEKAVHLLYFVVKNHPFSDGNKRSGAYAFVWFLKKTNLLNLSIIAPSTLTAITLLAAESDPKNKEKVIKLVLQLLRK